MATAAEIIEAEREARKQRLRNGRLLAIKDDGVPADDLALAQRVLDVVKAEDGAEFDRALASRNVAALFNLGVLYFPSWGDR